MCGTKMHIVAIGYP